MLVNYTRIHVHVRIGSALCALEGREDDIGRAAIDKLIDILDNQILLPQRDPNAPPLMPIENAFTVTGRGTVVIGVQFISYSLANPVSIINYTIA